MKRLIYKISIVASLISLTIACSKDDSNNNNSTDPRDKFVGSWLCKETSHLHGSTTYNVTISLNSTNSIQVYINNFYGANVKPYGVVANNYVTISDQSLGSFPHVSGSGSMSSSNTSTINWNYYVNDGADIDTCSAVYTKQ